MVEAGEERRVAPSKKRCCPSAVVHAEILRLRFAALRMTIENNSDTQLMVDERPRKGASK
jgi:hypothetical protein